MREGKVQAVPVDPKIADILERVIDSEGLLLGEEVIRVMSNTTRLDASPSIEAAQRTVTCPGRHRTDTAREGTPGSYEDGDPVNIRLGALRIGNVALTSVNAEIYTPIAQRLKASFQVLGSRLKPGCAETAIVNGLLDLIQADEKREAKETFRRVPVLPTCEP